MFFIRDLCCFSVELSKWLCCWRCKLGNCRHSCSVHSSFFVENLLSQFHLNSKLFRIFLPRHQSFPHHKRPVLAEYNFSCPLIDVFEASSVKSHMVMARASFSVSGRNLSFFSYLFVNCKVVPFIPFGILLYLFFLERLSLLYILHYIHCSSFFFRNTIMFFSFWIFMDFLDQIV